MSMNTLLFPNGDNIPALGLGTWKSPEGEVYDAVLEAIKAGYRHIDCAPIYGNEKEIGNALKKAFDDNLVKREELFITSKLWNADHLPEDVPAGLQRTLDDLQLSYLDLFLMHWPVALKPGTLFPKTPDDFLGPDKAPIEATWKAMEALKEKGLVKHIGVANFNQKNLQVLIEKGTHKPEMNQVELHPCLPQSDLINFCQAQNILVTAYSPLGSRDRAARMKKDDEPNMFELETIKTIADKHGKTPAQILLAWAVNRGTSVIPKSTNAGRIKQNLEADSITLSAEEMDQINNIDQHYRFVDGSFWASEGSPYTLDYLWK